MAQIASAKTRIKRNKKREEINSMRLSAVRTQIKKFQKDLASGVESFMDSFRKAEALLARAVSKGTIKKKTASRKIARLAHAAKKEAQK